MQWKWWQLLLLNAPPHFDWKEIPIRLIRTNNVPGFPEALENWPLSIPYSNILNLVASCWRTILQSSWPFQCVCSYPWAQILRYPWPPACLHGYNARKPSHPHRVPEPIWPYRTRKPMYLYFSYGISRDEIHSLGTL